jgi:hypothetical protein
MPERRELMQKDCGCCGDDTAACRATETGELIADQCVVDRAQLCRSRAAPLLFSRRSTVAFDALGGAKFDAESRVRTPDDVARLLELVVADHENEIVRNTDLAAHLEAGTYPGHIAHPAINTAGPVKADAAGLERPPTLFFPPFIHCCLRRQLASALLARPRHGLGRLTETANCMLGPPLYRAVKRIIKRPLKLLETANHGRAPGKAPDPSSIFACRGACAGCKGGLPPTLRHA